MTNLALLPGHHAFCRLEPAAGLPGWAMAGAFCSVTRTAEELSIVCPEDAVPAGVRCEGGWRLLRVEGTLEMGLVGIMAALTAPLAQAGISLMAIATFDTDYLLVREATLGRALAALRGAGHGVAGEDGVEAPAGGG